MRPTTLALALAAALAGPLSAASPVDLAARKIDGAAQELAAAQSAPDRIAAYGRAIAAYDEALVAMRVAVVDAGVREQDLALDLERRREEISRLLGALMRMSRTPTPAQALHPQGPAGAARASAMMSRLTPMLEAESDELAVELAALRDARRLQEQGTADLASGLEALNGARVDLAAAIAAKGTPLHEDPVGPALTMLARDSDTLTALAAALAASPDAPAGPLRGEAGKFLVPVPGDVLRRYNEPDAAGVRRPGIVMRAAPLSIVSAPADAVVRYAGPFLEYGYVVVLEPKRDTMIVLAGLAQIQVRTGDPVERGELLGLLGGRALDVEEYVMLPGADTGAGGTETLYIEVRQGRGPVDPAPLFAVGNG